MSKRENQTSKLETTIDIALLPLVSAAISLRRMTCTHMTTTIATITTATAIPIGGQVAIISHRHLLCSKVPVVETFDI